MIYFKFTRPMVAISQTAVVALLRGKLSLWMPACGVPPNGRTDTPQVGISQGQRLSAHLDASWEQMGSFGARPTHYFLPPVHDVFETFGPTKPAERTVTVEFGRKLYAYAARWRDATLIACADSFVTMVINNEIYQQSFSHITKSSQSGISVPAEFMRCIKVPFTGTVVSLSCGRAHTAAIIQLPADYSGNLARKRQLMLWGDNKFGQLARTDVGSRKPRWADTGDMLEVICLDTATITLVDGEIRCCGKISDKFAQTNHFVRVNMSAIPGRVISMRMIQQHISFMTDIGIAYTPASGDPRKGGFEQFAAYITGSRAHTLETIQHFTGLLHVYPHALAFNTIHICNWTDIGGL